MKLSDAIADYLAYIKYEKGHSQSTFQSYQSWLHNFQSWAKTVGLEDPTIEDFTDSLLRRYLYQLQGRKLRPRTIRGAFHPLRGLSQYLVDHDALPRSPADKLVLPKKDAAGRLTVSDREITQLFATLSLILKPKRAALARAVLSVFVYSGLRRQELFDLKVEDVNLSDKSIFVADGKGSKSRKLYVPDECISAVRDWLTYRSKVTRHPYLFALDTNRRIGEEGLRWLLEEIKALAGFKGARNILPHSIRHAFATRLLRNGANLKDIQTALGHSSIRTTEIYLHSDEEQLRGIANLSSLPADAPTVNLKTSPPRFNRVPLRT